MQTFVGSVIIIIIALVIYFIGLMEIDPILSTAFGVVFIYASIGIVRDSLKILSQAVPKDVDLERVKDSLEAIHGVKNVHHIHAWSIKPSVNFIAVQNTQTMGCDDIFSIPLIICKK